LALRAEFSRILIDGGQRPVDADAKGRRCHHHEELPLLLNASDALVHASVAEQFGQVLVGAMACGLPVIAVPATIVDDPETGWLVEPDDVGPSPPRWSRPSRIRPGGGDVGDAPARRSSAATPWGQIGREAAALIRYAVMTA